MAANSSATAPLASFAICLSGAFRTFNAVRENFVSALVHPNSVDVFVHIFFEPSRRDHRVALQFLRVRANIKSAAHPIHDLK